MFCQNMGLFLIFKQFLSRSFLGMNQCDKFEALDEQINSIYRRQSLSLDVGC